VRASNSGAPSKAEGAAASAAAVGVLKVPFSREYIGRDTVGRPVPSVPYPETKRLDPKLLWDEATGKPRPDVLTRHFLGEGRLHKADAAKLIQMATALLRTEANMIEVPAPVTVCGDVHGQLYDLVKLFEIGGSPAESSYLFLGDYVDRGYFSIEVLLVLYSYKVCYPTTFWMLRGNHESRHLTEYFTFKDECVYKYDADIWDLSCLSFDALPLAAIMNDQFFCVHGGLSPDIQTVEEIAELDRFCEPPSSGAFCDLLWSDPFEDYGASDNQDFEFNSTRGCSCVYGFAAVCEFLEVNDLLCVIRAHEAQDDGYRMYAKSSVSGFPTLITLFSAPNYLDSYGNKGAIMRYEGSTMNIRQFNHSPHPYWLPNFMNVVTWSLPFVADKLGEILLSITTLCDDEKEESSEREKINKSAEDQRRRVKSRIMAATRLIGMMRTLRSERETVLLLKSLAPGNNIPPGLLAKGPEALRAAVGNFQQSKELDSVNEMWPDSPRDSSMGRSEAERLAREQIEVAKMRRSSSSSIPTLTMSRTTSFDVAPEVLLSLDFPDSLSSTVVPDPAEDSPPMTSSSGIS
jgi:serine/threonine-protein phosphatase 2B catalytic subunit